MKHENRNERKMIATSHEISSSDLVLCLRYSQSATELYTHQNVIQKGSYNSTQQWFIQY